MPDEAFSVLLPVYAADSPTLLLRAFDSVTSEQSRPPAEVVLVSDGPLPDAVAGAVEDCAGRTTIPVTVVRLPTNVGLGHALEAGIERCTHDVVARMDADDVSLPERFARQLPVIEDGADIVGSALAEIGLDEDDVRGVRTPPLTHDRIARFARFHSPFHHPTVVLRRSAVRRAGGYQPLPALEDYWLWVRLLASGARAANLAEPLVRYRVAAGSYERRGGVQIARSELELQRRMRRLGFTSWAQFARNVLVRVGWRLVPVTIRRRIYGLVFRRDAGSDEAFA